MPLKRIGSRGVEASTHIPRVSYQDCLLVSSRIEGPLVTNAREAMRIWGHGFRRKLRMVALHLLDAWKTRCDGMVWYYCNVVVSVLSFGAKSGFRKGPWRTKPLRP